LGHDRERIEDRYARPEERRELAREVHELFRLHGPGRVDLALVPGNLVGFRLHGHLRARRCGGCQGGAHANSSPMMTCFTTSSIVVTSFSTMRIASSCRVRRPCCAAISRAALGGCPSTTH